MKKTNPSSSSKRNNEKYLYLTTRGRSSGLPREIEIWFTAFEDRFYVIAEYETSNWVRNIEACPEVKVRVGGEAFAGIARIIAAASGADLNARIQALSRDKYGWGDGLVVEITPKPGD